MVSAPGRADIPPVAINPAQSQHFSLAFAGQGAVLYQFVDQHGVASPAQVSFYQNGKLQLREYTIDGEGSIALPPGEYKAVVSRGFEYAMVEKLLTVTDGTPAHLPATLVRMVNTDGYLSLDAHVHSAPSPDSEVSPQLRIRTAVATGLEVMVATDHEIFTDLSPAVAALNMQSQIATIVGQEVTASIPNHTIAYPLPYDATQVRQFVAWHGLDIAQIFALEKSMGAQIRTFAHPRSDYLELIEWDRIKGTPGDVDPAHLGLPADATLWSWDFEAMEYMNGTQNVFSSGIFEDWMSFLNHGHRVVATGASDVHDLDIPGMPRSYFRSPTDSPAQFAEQHLVDAIKQGQVVVSTGAFARVLVNGIADMGDIVTDTDGSLALFMLVEAIPQIDVDHLRVYVNCDEVARVTATNPADSAVKYRNTIAVPIPVTTDAHVVVLGFGQQRLPAEFQQFDPAEVPRFTTNPVYIDTDGDGVFQAPGGKTCAI